MTLVLIPASRRHVIFRLVKLAELKPGVGSLELVYIVPCNEDFLSSPITRYASVSKSDFQLISN
jgi:hypothetical protein